MRKKMQRGFTLMELMVVIVIVAILAAVAVPLYINYVKDARRTEAKGGIGAIVTGATKYFQEKNTYSGLENENFATSTTWADVTDLKNWTFSVTNATATGFQVDAAGKPNTPTAQLGVRLVYVKGGAPTWTDDPSGP